MIFFYFPFSSFKLLFKKSQKLSISYLLRNNLYFAIFFDMFYLDLILSPCPTKDLFFIFTLFFFFKYFFEYTSLQVLNSLYEKKKSMNNFISGRSHFFFLISTVYYQLSFINKLRKISYDEIFIFIIE